jgi:WD40 repeat protein/DNA-binding SARP family transcriptional activator
MQLRLSLLGPFQATWAHTALEFATDSARALLAYLAVEAHPETGAHHEARVHRRETLAALLWPDRPQATAYSNLRQTLVLVRKALQDVQLSPSPLIVTAKTVQFHPAAALIDVVHMAELRSICAAHTHADLADCPDCYDRLSAAADLYRGEFLQGLYLERSQPFEEWLLFKREQVRRQTLEMLQTLTIAAERRAAYAQMAHFATRQLALEPWREQAHRQLMWALAADGQPGAALAQYGVCCRILAQQLDAQPAAETTALYEQIRSGIGVRRPAHATRQDDQAKIVAAPVTLAPLPLEPKLSEAPIVPTVFGRQHELAQLVAWLAHERCQVVALFGIGGVGKTTLAARAVQAVASHFDTVIWRSLLNAPPIEETIRACLQRLAGPAAADLPASLEWQLTLLLDYLRRERCLLVLDNLESVLRAGQTTTYRTGYEGYEQLVQRLAESKHASCLLITSRERPKAMARLEEDIPVVRSLRLAGLDAAAGQALLAARGLSGNDAHSAALVASYSGNPLALKVVAEAVQELFGGDIAAFLAAETAIFDDIRTVLDQQFDTLSPLEQEILIWLAVEREPVSLQTLRDNLLQPRPPHALMEALRTLERRSLLETVLSAPQSPGESEPGGRFMLQNVVLEYLTERLIEQICRELEEGHPIRLHSHALLKARAKEYVRRSQGRMILQPIITHLMASLGQAGWREQTKQLLTKLRNQARVLPSYAGGNLLNLLIHAGIELHGFDFSRLSIWQAYLQGVPLHRVDLRQADFRNTVFTQVFGRIHTLQLQRRDQLLVAGSAGGKPRLWRINAGQSIQEYPAPDLGANSVAFSAAVSAAFSPDGTILATVDLDHTICLWDVASGHLRQRLAGHTHVIWALAFTPDGTLVATGGADHTVRVWEVASGRCVHTLAGYDFAVTALAFTPDGQGLASGNVDGSLGLWDLRRGKLRQMLQAHEDEVHVLLFDPAGQRLISGSHDGTIRVWPVAPTSSESPLGAGHPLHTLRGHIDTVRTMAMNPDGRMLASGGGGVFVDLWDIHTGQLLHTMAELDDETVFLAFSPDGLLLASIGRDPTITLWDVRTWQRWDTLQVYTNPIYSIAFRPDSEQLLSGSADGALCLWSLRSGRVVKRFHGHSFGETKVAFSPDGETLASGSEDHVVYVWQVQSSDPRYQWRGHTARIECLRFSPTGELLASASKDRTIRLWDVRRGQASHVLIGHRERILTCAFCADGRLLASGGMDRIICLWDVESGQQYATLSGHTNTISWLAFSPDSRLLASSSYDGTVRLWNGQSGQMLALRLQLNTVVLTLAFHPTGELLALGCADHTIRLWHLPTAQVKTRLIGHIGTVESVQFSPDGTLLASSSVDETIRLWDLEQGVCRQTLRMPSLYAGMKIAGITGISEAQKVALKTLGAVEE